MNRLQRRRQWWHAAVLVLLGSLFFVPCPATAGTGDNYPAQWRNASLGAMYDTWGMATRYCTSWVAWALHDRNGYEIPFHDNARGWSAKAQARGIVVDTRPAKGAVAWWGAANHVAYVEGLVRSANGSLTGVNISEYNNPAGSGAYHTRTIAPSSPTGYIHFKDTKDAPEPLPAIKGDFSGDRISDIAAFYRYDGYQTNLWLWKGQPNRLTATPVAPWNASGFDAARLLPAGTGGFNADAHQDIAAFYSHPNGRIDLDIWYGDGASGLRAATAWHVDTAWEGARIVPAGAGDFNSDGLTDIAAFYRYDGQLVNLYVWYGQPGFTVSAPVRVWSGTGWEGARIVPVGVGDIDGDRKLDIVTFYRHDGQLVDYNVWYGNGAGAFAQARPWSSYNWDGGRLVSGGVADLNSDGRGDAVAFYRHNSTYTDMRVWWGSNTRKVGEPGGPWSANGWDAARILPAGTGDYNGDGRADIATFYRHEAQMVDLNIWYGDGTGRLQLTRAWHAATSWEGGRMTLAKG